MPYPRELTPLQIEVFPAAQSVWDRTGVRALLAAAGSCAMTFAALSLCAQITGPQQLFVGQVARLPQTAVPRSMHSTVLQWPQVRPSYGAALGASVAPEAAGDPEEVGRDPEEAMPAEVPLASPELEEYWDTLNVKGLRKELRERGATNYSDLPRDAALQRLREIEAAPTPVNTKSLGWMTRLNADDLRKLAKEAGIKGTWKMRKAELIERVSALLDAEESARGSREAQP
uniref:Rho termination factor-like N-terminal domain-containing protein n=1 Tax=Eutreptiella gymnastica TaxID=73025 RepID=A0A7S4LKR4_9EUGL